MATGYDNTNQLVLWEKPEHLILKASGKVNIEGHDYDLGVFRGTRLEGETFDFTGKVTEGDARHLIGYINFTLRDDESWVGILNAKPLGKRFKVKVTPMQGEKENSPTHRGKLLLID